MRAAQAQPARAPAPSCSTIVNYSADAGAGSRIVANISESPGWRAMLLGTVAASSLWLYSARSARADCAADGPTILNCTGIIAGNVAPGVVNGGILVPNTYTTLNVYDLDANITPNATVDGIYFHRTGAGNNVVINSDTTPFRIVTTGILADGIDAQSGAAITITQRGDIDASAGRYGIFALVYAGVGPLNITSYGDIAGNTRGISATNLGTGTLEIVAHGDVEGTNIGIFAQSSGVDGDGTSLSITTQGVTRGNYAISAINLGIGALEIAANGAVEGTGANSRGIKSLNVGTGLSIDSQGVTGGRYGIYARNYGSGALEIVANGDVEGTDIAGIYARNNNGVDADTGISLSIVSEAVTGGERGIDARNFGTGALEIVANGAVGDPTGIVPSNAGIYARQHNAAATGPLSITSEGVTGGNTGIDARNYGTGALEIVAKGDVEGTGIIGIEARNYGTHLSVTSEGVSGGINGMDAYNYGSGALTIVANGDVEGTANTGIYAKNYGVDLVSGKSLSITSHGKVTGGNDGILARNYGTGALEIVANGDVTSTNLTGIYAYSQTTAIDMTVGAGATVAGDTGVRFVEGAANTLNNYGHVRSLRPITGVNIAISGGFGSETVNNFGVVTGDVVLGFGTNTFNNMAGGLFNSGTTVYLGFGPDDVLTNHGTLSPGGAGTILTTMLWGDFSQPGSELEIDVQGANADRLIVSNGTAALAGKVRPLFTLSGLGSNTQWTVLTGLIVDNGIEAVDTAAVDFDLIFPLATQMDLVLLGVNFAPSGLNKNEAAVGNNLTKIYENGSGDLVKLLDAFAALPSIGALANALDQLSPEIYLDTQIATLFSAQNFTSSLMTCPVREGPAAFIEEGQCVWARLSGRDLDQSATFQTFGFDEQSIEVAGGVQGALGDVWRVGFAGAYERSHLDTTTNASSDADRIHGGAVLKYNPGALLLAGAVSGGWGWYETDRPIAFPGFAALAQSDHDVGYVNGRLRAAYQLGTGNWYAKPMVDLDATHLRLDSLRETGAGAVGLNVRGANETVLSATPALELGAQFGAPNGTLVRPYVRGGATFYDDPDFVLLASFEGAPSGVGPFRIATSTDDVIGNVGAGVDVIGVEGASLRLYYEGRFGDLVEQHGGGIKGTLPF